MPNVVSIQIQLDDNGTPQMVQKVEDSFTSLGKNGAAAMGNVSSAVAGFSGALDQNTSKTVAATESYDKITTAAAAAAAAIERVATAQKSQQQTKAPATPEMSSMMDNINRAQKENFNSQQMWQGPMTKLAHSFEIFGTAQADMENLGNAFANMPNKINPASDAAERFGNTTSTHTASALDKVRLLSQVFGLQLPRALESMLSRMPAVTAAIAGLTTGIVAISAFEIGSHIAKGLDEAYERFFNVNQQVDKYLQSAGKSANTRLFDEASLETSVGLLREANQQIADLERKRSVAGADKLGGGFLQYVRELAIQAGDAEAARSGVQINHGQPHTPNIFNEKDDADLADAYARRDTANMRRNDITRQDDADRLKTRDSAQASSLLGYSQATRERDNAIAEAKLARQQALAHEQDLTKAEQAVRDAQAKRGVAAQDLQQVHPVDQNAGLADYNRAVDAANESYAAKSTNLARKEHDEVVGLRNQAVEAGLEGEAKYQSAMEHSIDAIVRKWREGELSQQGMAAETAAVRERFAAEQEQRIEAQQLAAQKMVRDAQLTGLTGAARIQGEHAAKIEDINTDRTLDPAAAAEQRRAAQLVADQGMEQLDRDYTERTKALAAERADAATGALGRIEASVARAHAELDKSFNTTFGGTTAPQDAQDSYHQASQAVDADGDRQRRELSARNQAEDLQIAREAAQAESRVRQSGLAGWASAYRSTLTEIQAQEDQRLAKLDQDASKESLTWQEVAQRRQDIERTADAQIAEQQMQLRDQLAGSLQQAFTNPVEFIKSKMQQMFFEIIADWIMRTKTFQSFLGSSLSSVHLGGNSTALSGGSSIAQVLGIGGTTGTATDGSVPLTGGSGGTGYSSTAAGTGAGISSGNVSSSISGVASGIQSIAQYSRQSAAASSASSGDDDAAWSTRGQAEDDANAASTSSSSWLGTAATDATLAYGAYSGAKGVYDSFSQTGANGLLSGASSGAAMGGAIGMFAGPEGAAIGAAAGAVAGATVNAVGQALGIAGRDKARDYFNQTLKPEIEGVKNDFGQGGGDYMSAVSQINADGATGYEYMSTHFSQSAADWVKSNYLDKEVAYAVSEVERLASSGSSYMTRSAAQFHTGGVISGFHDFATSPNEGFIHAMLGEGVVSVNAMQTHAPYVAAMNAGASPVDMASRYLQAAGGNVGASGGVTNVNHEHNYSLLDLKGFKSFLEDGGTEAINASQNRRTGFYAGDAIG
ncbi:hypothetical protein ACFQBQ_07565 [Granulicella cerasi]|uniref:Bacteriophage tail tape measure N-terminal domain-containing protein n=1 Tax=Granulicella cerasi TaxID=741063 RepID=A0ABW1Z8K6_9BACT|nr:hypothetical protein [Granulicella cerasi]